MMACMVFLLDFLLVFFMDVLIELRIYVVFYLLRGFFVDMLMDCLWNSWSMSHVFLYWLRGGFPLRLHSSLWTSSWTF